MTDEQPQEEQPEFDRDAMLNPEPNSIDLLNREARERAGDDAQTAAEAAAEREANAADAEAPAEPEAETNA